MIIQTVRRLSICKHRQNFIACLNYGMSTRYKKLFYQSKSHVYMEFELCCAVIFGMESFCSKNLNLFVFVSFCFFFSFSLFIGYRFKVYILNLQLYSISFENSLKIASFNHIPVQISPY